MSIPFLVLVQTNSLQCLESVAQRYLQILFICIGHCCHSRHSFTHVSNLQLLWNAKKQFDLKQNASFFVVIALPVKHCIQLAATSIASSSWPGLYIMMLFLVSKRKGKEAVVTSTHHSQRLVLFKKQFYISYMQLINVDCD